MFVLKGKYDAALQDAERYRAEAVLAEARNNQLNERLKACAVVIANGDNRAGWLLSELNAANARADEACGRLASIIAMETPGMANIGRKMVRAARGEV